MRITQVPKSQNIIHGLFPISSMPLAQAALPSPPADPPPPPNQRKPGGGLNPFKQACNPSRPSLTALIPVNQHTWTAVAHPTLLFYIPDQPEEIIQGEFSILTADEKIRIYHLKFTLPQVPGIISISLPKRPQYALQEGQLYRWYFKLDCQSSTNITTDLDVNGWIQRVPAQEGKQQHLETANPLIWYDTIATLAAQRQVSPKDTNLRQRWQQLLQGIELQHLASVPFVGPVRPLQP